MTINPTTLTNTQIAGASLAGAAIGAVATVGICKGISKLTGKPVGIAGSPAHVLTNDKVDSKMGVFKDQFVGGLKTDAKVLGVTGIAAGLGALAAKKSPELVDTLKSVKNTFSETFAQELKSVIKDTKVYQKLSALPTPAKVAVAVGSYALLIGSTIAGLSKIAKYGYIEGQHETK